MTATMRGTAESWLLERDLVRLLRHARCTATDRKLRLYGCAWVRRSWDGLSRFGREAVEAAERYADGGLTADELAGAARRVLVRRRSRCGWADSQAFFTACGSADNAANVTLFCFARVRTPTRIRTEQLALFREVFVNPFRQFTFDPAWVAANDGTVGRIARSVYDGRDYDQMPILSDALEEAGCTDAEVLGHLRSPGPHVRGCWALDLVLGRS
jgi:hypothetical protein